MTMGWRASAAGVHHGPAHGPVLSRPQAARPAGRPAGRPAAWAADSGAAGAGTAAQARPIPLLAAAAPSARPPSAAGEPRAASAPETFTLPGEPDGSTNRVSR